MTVKECKRCLLREAAEADTLTLIRDKLNALPSADRAEDSLYQSRLEACKTCEHLLSGVCMKCGCYVEFRAGVKRMKCPNVKARKW